MEGGREGGRKREVGREEKEEGEAGKGAQQIWQTKLDSVRKAIDGIIQDQ